MSSSLFSRTQSPSSQLFLIFGLFFLCYLIALLVTTGIALSGISLDQISNANDISDLLKFNLNDDVFVTKLKWAQLAASILIFIVPPLLFVKLTALPGPFSEGKPSGGMLDYFKLNSSFPFLFALIIPVLMMASLPLINVMAELNEKMSLPGFLQGVEQWMRNAEEEAKVTTEAFLKMESFGSMIFNVAVIAIVPAFGEELLFRGVIQKLFTKWTKNAHWGIWIAAALFSALHAQFFGFFPRMALGALLGYLLLWSGSLWVPILAHFINNGAAVLVSFLIQRGTISKEVENVGTGQDELYFILSSLILVSGLLWMIWNRRVAGDEKEIKE